MTHINSIDEAVEAFLDGTIEERSDLVLLHWTGLLFPSAPALAG